MVRSGCRKLTGVALAGALLSARPALAAAPSPAPAPAVKPDALGLQLMDKAKAGKPLWATLTTSQGKIVVELETAAAPQSSATFVGLATGGLVWTQNKLPTAAPLYDGTLFHRAVPGFAIQGGDPTGTGTGGPGFTTPDEAQTPAQKPLHFQRGTVGLAHTPDPNGNGSQFFIVIGDAPWLDGRYTQIGKVAAGLEVADAIGNAPRGPQDKPLAPVTLQSVRISEKPPASAPAKKPGKKSR